MITEHAVHPFLSDLFRLDGKVAIVTGAGSGIGHGIARYLANAGAQVVIADNNPAAGRRVCGELNDGSVPVSAFIETDVSDEAGVKSLIRGTLETFGTLDILVNDAGIFPQKSIAEMTLADWERIQDVNLRGTFLCLREAALQMRKQGHGGRIINISSIDAVHPSMTGLAHYDASKAGVNALTRSAALEFGRDHITVNAIMPGLIATEGVAAMSAGTAAAANDLFMKRTALGRAGTPEDIAGCALFLAGKAADYVTGQTFIVDGGFLIG